MQVDREVLRIGETRIDPAQGGIYELSADERAWRNWAVVFVISCQRSGLMAISAQACGMADPLRT